MLCFYEFVESQNFCWFIFNRIKKRRKSKVKIVTLQLFEVKKSDISHMKNSPHVPLRLITEEKRRGKDLRVV
jgi:hypothetical protein